MMKTKRVFEVERQFFVCAGRFSASLAVPRPQLLLATLAREGVARE